MPVYGLRLAAFSGQVLKQDPVLLTTMIVLGTDLCKNIDIYSFTEKASHMLAGLWPESEIYRELKGEALVLQGLLTLLRGDAESVFSYVREALKYRREGACMVRSLLVFVLSVVHQVAEDTSEQPFTDLLPPPVKPNCPRFEQHGNRRKTMYFHCNR
ncbi:hypothetical protein [Desulfoluna spongiiphila]|uniref:hypothetical protein n=1 Tax=Desulfoluna spongiiphila TaxID=419481 RepID=UPI00186AB488|nr:hypothetical protein [Desulfoluna spongiiphila]